MKVTTGIMVCIATVLLTVVAGEHVVMGDTFKLTDGTVLICKVIQESETSYIVANSYGTFTVRKNNVAELHETKTYLDDIKILKSMGIKTDDETVKKNVEEGIKRKERGLVDEADQKKMTGGIGKKAWNYGRISLEAVYYNTAPSGFLSRYGADIKTPHGLAFQIAYDQGLDALLGRRCWALPGLRIEAGYLNFGRSFFNASPRIEGVSVQAGPLWAMPSLQGAYGCFVVGLLPGAGYFLAVNRSTRSRSSTGHFVLAGIAGYEYAFGTAALFVHARYIFIQDSGVVFHGIGCSMGIAVRLL